MRLLIVDDNALFREELASLLIDEGHDVVAVESADAAVAELTQRSCDAVLTDLRMPRRSGTALLDEIGVRWPDTRSVILTGQSNEEAVADCLRHGAIDFLGKPFQMVRVTRVLDQIRQDIEFEDSIAPVWTDAEGARLARRVGRIGLVGGALPGLGPRVDPIDEHSASVHTWASAASDSASESSPSYVVFHPVDLGSASPDRRSLLARSQSIVEAAGPTIPVVLVVPRLLVHPMTLLALWLLVNEVREPANFRGAIGPQRREILRLLVERELDLDVIAREVGGPDGPQIRPYVEHLVDEGLVRVRGDRYALTALGRTVAETMVRATSGPRSNRDVCRLFVTRP